MPEANIALFNLEGKSRPELEARRRELVSELATKHPNGYDDPSIPLELLTELAVLTSTLRAKNAGPPKAPKKTPSNAKMSTDDLLI